jgi:ArsR family transcriptional regulator
VSKRIPLPEAARLFRALANETRLRLLLLLYQHGEATVGDLARAAGVCYSTVSNRLALLRLGGLVGWRRVGRHHYYRLTSPRAAGLLRDVGPG